MNISRLQINDSVELKQAAPALQKKLDIQVMEKLKKVISNDLELSRETKKVGVYVYHNEIFLKGNVSNENEMKKILEYAYLLAPEMKVVNEMNVVKQ